MRSHQCLRYGLVACSILLSLATVTSVQAGLYATTGQITYLRAHALGSGWGPPTDFIDVEIIVKLDSQPGKAFGFQLRDNNSDTSLRKAMFDILLKAYKNNWPVTIDFYLDPGKNNGIVHRVQLSK